MPRRKLFVLLGAGASVSVGMPGVRQVDELMREWAAVEGVYDGVRCTPNFYQHAWDAVGRHFAGSRFEHDGSQNFELALAQMLALANWVRRRPYGRPLRDLIGLEDQLPELFSEVRDLEMSPATFAASVSVSTQYSRLVGQLADHMRGCSHDISSRNPEGMAAYNSIMDRIRERFDIGIYSLNYDSVALQTFPEAFIGFTGGVDEEGCQLFDPAAVHARTEWGFLYHLHGSVHYTLPSFESRLGVFQDGIRWREDLGGAFRSANTHGGSVLDERSDRTEIPATTLIAGGQKLDQLMGEPFQSMYASLMRHAHEADGFLIIGYGFGDMHVNRALLSRMTRPGDKPPVMILEWTQPTLDTMFTRHDGWPWRLLWALGVSGGSFDMIPGRVGGIRQRKWFEQAHGHIAVWHNGFLEAAERLDDILDALDGNWQAINHPWAGGLRRAREREDRPPL